MCAICKEDYVMNDLEGRCHICDIKGDSGTWTLGAIGLGVILFIALCIYHRKRIGDALQKYAPGVLDIKDDILEARVKIKIGAQISRPSFGTPH